MAYNRTTWTDGASPPISAANLNIIELGIVNSLPMDGISPMTGQLKTIAGTGETAAIAPNGDPNTGICFPAADTIAFSRGGLEAMRIDSSGNVAIGGTVPASTRLYVGGTLNATWFSGPVSGNATSATSATNLSGGGQGQLPYQSNTATTSFLAAGVSKQVLISNGTFAPSWVELDMTYVPTSSFKKSVKVATTANIPVSGTTSTTLILTTGVTILDGITLSVNDRILVKDQTVASQNGIYSYTSSTLWTRPSDVDESDEVDGATVNVDSGTVNGGYLFSNNFKSGDVIGTNNMIWYRLISTGDASSTNPLGDGVASAGTSTFYSRADHVHPTDTSRAPLNTPSFTGNVTIGGTLIVQAGSSAIPSISPTGDNNTGIFFPAADTIAFGEGGIEVMRINSSSQVGIGTTNPTAKLEVVGGGSFSSDLVVNGLKIGKGAGSIASNTAIGASALAANTSGLYAVAVGDQSLSSNTTGSDNTALGYRTLQNNTTGSNNVAVGSKALQLGSSGSDNIAVGVNSQQGGGNGSSNISIGSYTLSAVAGLDNVGIGHIAANLMTTGNRNVAVGARALQGTTTASDNIAIGFKALSGLTNSASSLVAIGASALAANTTGTENVSIGFQALRLNTTGNFNTAIGYNALYSNTTGAANVALGKGSLSAVTSGTDNLGLGYNALFGITNTSNNIAIGSNAGSNITTGANNTIVGSLPATAALFSTVLLGAGTTERLKVDATGAYINGSPYVVFTTAGGAIGGTVTPSVNNAYELGSATNRWSTIYSQNALNVSDERLKTDIADSRLGLDFISSLRPVEYKFIEGRNIVTSDEQGEPIVTSVPGVRTHFGLIAQELKSSLPDGLDFAGWCLDNKDDLNSLQSIGYTELIAPMIKAIQELSQKVKDLESQLTNK